MARSSRLFICPQNTQNTNRVHSAIIASFFNTKYVGLNINRTTINKAMQIWTSQAVAVGLSISDAKGRRLN
ncbi:hypothetical protein Glove_138g37 [Diversispora epigaea]|uniref:Uncharacterized protein n=1 Tax=Diversispora epigaea TaxID=1348612 RepID=A0A397J028_9GLOM|nr:hypothetical protein Glove_138g37 [Diversispora epigaea]